MPAVRDYVVKMVVAGVQDPAYDGVSFGNRGEKKRISSQHSFNGPPRQTFTDDEIGFPVEHENAPFVMGMTATQMADVRYWAQITSGVVIDALHSIGKYAFQAFFDGSYDGGNVGPAPTAATCTTFMTQYCDPSFQNISFTMLLDDASLNQTMAGFLVKEDKGVFEISSLITTFCTVTGCARASGLHWLWLGQRTGDLAARVFVGCGRAARPVHADQARRLHAGLVLRQCHSRLQHLDWSRSC